MGVAHPVIDNGEVVLWLRALTPGDLGQVDVVVDAGAAGVDHVLVVPARQLEQRTGVAIGVQQATRAR